MLAAMYILQRGTPFIYQGQEIGMLNIKLPRLEDYPDVMAQNNARILSRFLPKKKVLELIQRSSRDSARTPMQWSAERNAGFSTHEPWLPVNSNYPLINAAAQEEDPDSILNFYRRLLAFRKEDPAALYGDYEERDPENPDFYVYERSFERERLLVICSFSSELKRFNAPEGCDLERGELVLSNYDFNFIIENGYTARPYELRVYRLNEADYDG